VRGEQGVSQAEPTLKIIGTASIAQERQAAGTKTIESVREASKGQAKLPSTPENAIHRRLSRLSEWQSVQ